jgi:predicted metalloprotease
MALPVGGGIGGLVLLLLFSMLTGQNPIDYIDTSTPQQTTGTSGVPGDDPQAEFVSVVLADTEDTWGEIFAQRGATYPKPTLVLFTEATQSACGVGQSAMGPFYCPNDRKVYLDPRSSTTWKRDSARPAISHRRMSWRTKSATTSRL